MYSTRVSAFRKSSPEKNKKSPKKKRFLKFGKPVFRNRCQTGSQVHVWQANREIGRPKRLTCHRQTPH